MEGSRRCVFIMDPRLEEAPFAIQRRLRKDDIIIHSGSHYTVSRVYTYINAYDYDKEYFVWGFILGHSIKSKRLVCGWKH